MLLQLKFVLTFTSQWIQDKNEQIILFAPSFFKELRARDSTKKITIFKPHLRIYLKLV